MLMSAVVADSEGVVLSTSLKMEVQPWLLDEWMVQTMFLVATALKRVVQQWTPADGVTRAMSLEVATNLKRVVQVCRLAEGEMCAILFEVVAPGKRMIQL